MDSKAEKTKLAFKILCRHQNAKKIIICRGNLHSSEMWQSPEIWEWQWGAKITFTKEWRADYVGGMLVRVTFRIMCLTNSHEKKVRINIAKLKLNSVDLVHKRTISTERPPLVVKLVPIFADRGCCVVSATDPHGRNLGFLDPEPLLFHSSSSSIILTRLIGPRFRPTTSQKIW
jgi:hypothetical protein